LTAFQGDRHSRSIDRACNQRAEIAAAVSYDDDMLSAGKKLRDFVFDRFGSDIVAQSSG